MKTLFKTIGATICSIGAVVDVGEVVKLVEEHGSPRQAAGWTLMGIGAAIMVRQFLRPATPTDGNAKHAVRSAPSV